MMGFCTRFGFACAVNIVLGIAGFTLMIHLDPLDWRWSSTEWRGGGDVWIGPLWLCIDDNRPSAYDDYDTLVARGKAEP